MCLPPGPSKLAETPHVRSLQFRTLHEMCTLRYTDPELLSFPHKCVCPMIWAWYFTDYAGLLVSIGEVQRLLSPICISYRDRRAATSIDEIATAMRSQVFRCPTGISWDPVGKLDSIGTPVCSCRDVAQGFSMVPHDPCMWIYTHHLVSLGSLDSAPYSEIPFRIEQFGPCGLRSQAPANPLQVRKDLFALSNFNP